MPHVRPMTARRPASGQLDIFLEVLSVLSAVIGIIRQISDAFGLGWGDKGSAST